MEFVFFLECAKICGIPEPVDDLPPIQTQLLGIIMALIPSSLVLLAFIASPKKTWRRFLDLGRKKNQEDDTSNQERPSQEELDQQWSIERRKVSVGILCVVFMAVLLIGIAELTS